MLYACAVFFALQPLSVALRVGPRAKQTSLDMATQARIATPLKELCATAVCDIPTVRARWGLIAVGVLLQKSRWILLLSREFDNVVSDDELRFVLAHEVAHIIHDDYAATRRTAQLTTVIILSVGFIIIFRNDSWNSIPVFRDMLAPAIVLVQLLVGPVTRRRETRADVGGVKFNGDLDVAVRSLRAVYAFVVKTRREFFGPSALSW